MESSIVVQAEPLRLERQRGARRFPWPALRHPLRPGVAALHRTMMPRYSFGVGTCAGDLFHTPHSDFHIGSPLPWHHRSTPSMAPGLSCADRPWTGVPAASLFIFDRNGQTFWCLMPRRFRWNVHPVFRRVVESIASIAEMRGGCVGTSTPRSSADWNAFSFTQRR